MAKRKKNIVEIDVGNHIFYKWRGADTSRLKGNTGKQAPIAKKQAAILGKASALSAKLRAAFVPILPPPVKRKALNRFNNAIQQWLRLGEVAGTAPFDNISFISGFTFYGTQVLDSYLSHFSVKRMADDGIALCISDLDTLAFSGTLPSNGNAHLHIIAASVNVKSPQDALSAGMETDIYYPGGNFHGQVLALPLQTQPGYLTVVAFSTDGRNIGIAGAMYN